MNTALFMHCLGLASLPVMGGAGANAIATIFTELDENWHRITAALRGEGGFALMDECPSDSTTSQGVA